MRTLKLYRPEQYTVMPWKNGGGTTLEIMQAGGCGEGDYDWRLSIAQVKEDGPFSVFAGYGRILTVLEGEGLVLTVEGHDSAPLRPFQPFSFDGGAKVSCRLAASAIEDFNLIYRQDRVRAQVRWVDCQPAVALASAAKDVIFFNASREPVVVTDVDAGSRHELPYQAVLHCTDTGGRALRYNLEGPCAHVGIIELQPR